MQTNKLEDGPSQVFRCYAAALEVAFKGFRENNRFNLALLVRRKTSSAMRELILESLPRQALKVRLHVAGDFFSQAYFDAWMQVAQARPRVKFYAYTKSFHFWQSWLRRHGALPGNMTLTASIGSKFDDLIQADWITAKVVFHPDMAKKDKRAIDHTDVHAQNPKKPFALLLHAVQPAGSEAARAIKRMKEEGIDFSYS